MSRYEKFKESMESQGVEMYSMEDMEYQDTVVRDFSINKASIHTIRDEMTKTLSQYSREDWLVWELCRTTAILEKCEVARNERAQRLYEQESKHEAGLRQLDDEVAALEEMVRRLDAEAIQGERMLERFPEVEDMDADPAASSTAEPWPEPAPEVALEPPQPVQPQREPPAAAHAGRWGSSSASTRQTAPAAAEAQALAPPRPEPSAQAPAAATNPQGATAAPQPGAPAEVLRDPSLPVSRPPPPPVPSGHVPPAAPVLLQPPMFAAPAIAVPRPLPKQPPIDDDNEVSDEENPWAGCG